MIVDTFQEIAFTNDWYFEYGHRDYQNLYDQKDGKEFKLFLDAVQEDVIYSELGNIEGTSYFGYFTLLTKSELDEVYHNQKDTDPSNGKYEKYIKPCRAKAMSMVDMLTCLNLQVKKWKITDAINVFSDNLDGVVVNFSIEKL